MNNHSPATWDEYQEGIWLSTHSPYDCHFVITSLRCTFVIGIRGDTAYLEMISECWRKVIISWEHPVPVVSINRYPAAVTGRVFHLRNFLHGCF